MIHVRRHHVLTALSVAGLAVAYATVAVIGRAALVDGTGTALLWPASGVAMWWVWRARTGTRAGHLLIGVAGADIAVGAASGSPTAALTTLAVVAETVAGVALLSVLTRGHLDSANPRERTLRDMRAIAVAALISPALGASAAATLIAGPTGSATGWASDWWVWFVADGLGILVVLLTCTAIRDVRRAAITRQLLLEAGLVATGQAAILVVTISAETPLPGSQAWPYYLIPGLFWAATRLGPAVTACISGATGIVVVAATAQSVGPFAAGTDAREAVLAAELFVAVVVFAAVGVAYMVRDGRTVELLLRQRTLAMEHALDGIGYVRAGGTLHSANPALAAMVARVDGDLAGGDWQAVLVPDDVPLAAAALAAVAANGSASTTLRLRAVGGGMLRFQITLVADTSPGATGHHVFARDVTERDAARTHLDSLFTLSPDLLLVSQKGQMIRANPAWESLLGYPTDQLLGRNLMDYFHPDDIGRAREQLSRMRHEPVLSNFDIRVRAADGHYVWVRWNAVRDGELDQAYSVGHDLTVIKQTQEALATARDDALEASRLKSQFLATMSHEIRTPLNGVIGLGELLADTPLNATQQRYADGITRAGSTLLTLINEVLDFSKIEAGKFVLDDVDFQLTSLLDDVTAICGETANRKGLTLDIHVAPGLPTALRGDPTRVRQIMLNLVGNAIKFTAEGGVRVDVGRHDVEAVLTMDVIDTGRGIDPSAIGALFQPFSQIDADPGVSGGTGLGLAISQQLAEAMGGTIEVESALGFGARFRFTLPLIPATAPSTDAPTTTGQLRVLVVADDDAGRSALVDQLLGWGMHVEGAADGDQAQAVLAREAAQSRQFDVAIVDMAGDGAAAELATGMAGYPDVASLPTILLTAGEVLGPDADGGLNSATLTKPVTRSTLYDALVNVTVMRGRAERALVRGRVLLVEDNEINQIVATGLLQRLGYTTDLASDGIEAVEMAGARPYQVILMDVQMPRMDGYAATRALRALPATRHTPIVAMTANAHAEAKALCASAGMDDYLSKPIRSHDLEATLLKWTAARPSGRTQGDVTIPAQATGDHQRSQGIDHRLSELLGTATSDERAMVGAIVTSFLERAPRMVEDLVGATGREAWSEVNAMAHSLKGAAVNLGADRLAELCQRLETGRSAADGSPAADLTAAAALTGVLDETVRELQRWLVDHAVETGPALQRS